MEYFNQSFQDSIEQVAGTVKAFPWAAIEPSQQQRIARSLAPDTQISGIVYPTTEAELTDVITAAAQQNWRMLPSGAGSKLDWGGLVQADIAISTQRLNRLIDHAVGDLTVTVEAGMRFAELQAILAKTGQFLAIDPAYPTEATIGGIVATADTGSLRQRYNGVRDMLLGLSFVRADGQIAKAGGRVVKNVAGYDLMKLFTGSYGTLGVISQVTFRVYPLPEASQTVVLTGEAQAIAQAAATVLNSALTPAAADILSATAVKALAIGQGMGLAVRFQSLRLSVEQQVSRVIDIGKAVGLADITVLEADDALLWQRLQEQMTPATPDGQITCKIGVRPSAAVAILKQIEPIAIAPWSGRIHIASGLGTIVLQASTQPDIILKIRSLCQVNSGFLSILQAPAPLKQQVDVWGYTGSALDLMRQLKQQFDPKALLSPQRFIGGI